MAGSKKKPAIEKHQLKSAEIKKLVARWQTLKAAIEPLQTEVDAIRETLVADMDPKEAYEFVGVSLRCIQGKSRKGLNWKKIAFDLAKRLYPDTKSLRGWLLALARKFPHVPNKPYVQLFIAEEEN